MFPGGMEVGREEIEALTRVIESKNLFRYTASAPDRTKSFFEREFAELMGSKHALCSTRLGGADLCPDRRGRREGDEVNRPGVHLERDAERGARLACASRPRRVDESLTLDPADVERRITPRTRAILRCTCAVRLRRWTSSWQSRRNTTSCCIEDVCQAAGATYRGRRLGTLGDAGAFSCSSTRSSRQARGSADHGSRRSAGSRSRRARLRQRRPARVGLRSSRATTSVPPS